MTLEELRKLDSPELDLWLRELQEGNDEELRLQNRLRAELDVSTARAAAELIRLRGKARHKFPSGRVRWFDREGFEQSTGEAVAAYRAERFRGLGRVCDAFLGIGGDGVALAEHAEVVGIERSPVRCKLASLNAREAGAERLSIVCADTETWLPPHDAVLLDPSRRSGHRRFVNVNELNPSWEFCVTAAVQARAAAITLSPVMHPEDFDLDAEFEFVSRDGECRDQTVWFGEAKRGRVRATVLPSGDTVTSDDAVNETAYPIMEWLYVPDPAVSRARLSPQCAARFGVRMVSRDVEILTGDRLVETPLLRPYRVTEVIRWRRKTLRQEFRRLNAKPEIVVRRGTKATVDKLKTFFPKDGDRRVAAIFLHISEGPVVVVSDLEAT